MQRPEYMHDRRLVQRNKMSHWGWAVPIFLISAALTISQIDSLPPRWDEWFTMYTAGWLVEGPFSPSEIVQAVQTYTPDHMPGYIMLVSLWGNLTAWEVELGRLLSIYGGLLFLALAYRLGQDFVAPVGGLLALTVVASNAVFNWYFPLMRMYTMLPLASSLVLWLYLRVTHQQRPGRCRRRDFIALGAAVFLLMQTHLFCMIFLLMLGTYHLIIAPKNRHWISVSATVIGAVLLMLPFLVQMLSVVDILAEDRARQSIDGSTALYSWLAVYLNGQGLLLLLSILGLLLGVYKRKVVPKPWLAMPFIFLFLLAILAQFTTWFTVSHMHYHLSGWLPSVILFVSGIYAWYRFRRGLVLLVLLWPLAGAVFQVTGISDYIPSAYLVEPSPTQAISRLATRAMPGPAIVGFRLDALERLILHWNGKFYFPEHIDYSLAHHYFERRNLSHRAVNDLEEFEEYASRGAITTPSVWTYFKTSVVSTEESAAIEALLDTLGYDLCDSVHVGIDTTITQHVWKALRCQQPQLISSQRTEKLDYRFYGAVMDAEASKVYIVDEWKAADDAAIESFSISYQLLATGWKKGGQLDLAIENPNELRMYHIDVSEARFGTYELIAVVYHSRTGERQAWLNNPGEIAEILKLSQFDIP